MIDVRELRIGNNILDNGEAIQVTAATIMDIVQYRIAYDPIPLEPKILEKCGFEKITIDRVIFWEIKVGKFGKFQFYKGVLQFGILGVGNYEYHDIQPKYLHQLQNLYYSLTNTELNFKP